MKRIIFAMTILTIIYLLIAFCGNGLNYITLITMPMAYMLLIIYMPNKKNL